MERTASNLAARLLAALERLAHSPLSVLCLMLATNALVHPYRGLFHDARLYAAQVTERVSPGSLGQDLYLRFGSQDDYSVFTRVMAPAVQIAGLDPAFFLAYLGCKALFFWALLRLVFVLVPERVAGLLALLSLAAAPLPFGGNEIFHLNEPFLTPRLPACALALFALERALAGRPVQAVLLLAGALLLHPLMAFGGLLVVVLWWLATRVSPARLAAPGLAVALAGCAVVFWEPLGLRLFGYMDDEWLAANRHVCFFIDPAVWTAGDWGRIACCAGVVAWAALSYGRSQSALLLALLGAAALGFAGSLVAAHSHYLLLIQASPYRALWLLEVLAVPVGFWGAAWLWRRGSPAGRCAAPLLLLLLTADWNLAPLSPAAVFVALLPVCVVYHRGLGRLPHAPGWSGASAASAFLAGAAVLLAYNVSVLLRLAAAETTFERDIHPLAVLQVAGLLAYKLPVVLAVALAAAVAVRGLGGGARFRAALVGFWLGYQAVLGWADGSAWYNARYSVRQRHKLLAADYLKGQAAGRPAPLTVYWTADLRDVWFRVGANCYFDSVQLSGCAYARGTAVEGLRRARLVRRFEADCLRRAPHPQPWWQQALLGLYNVPQGEAPTGEDLLALCAEEGLDFVVLDRCVPGFPCVADGRHYVYDCRRLRARARPGRTAQQYPAGPSQP
jgi:hypothetical protein